MSDTVEYIVKLKDEMSGTVNAVKHSTSAMNKEIEHSHSVVHELRNAFFELFAVEKALEFFNGAREALEKYKFASAELNATLESNAENIGFTRKELDALGDAARKNTLFTKTDVTAMEGQLAIFKNVHGYIAQEAIPIILNYAAKTKTTAAEAAKTLGIALNEPAHAARLLRGAIGGVDGAQQQYIDNLVKTGQAAKAQQYILDLMNESYKGAAAAAWEAADPLARLGVRFEDTKIAVGELIEKLLEKLEPVMNAVVDIIDSSVKWFNDYSNVIKIAAAAVVSLTTALIGLWTWQKVTAVWAAIQYVSIGILGDAFETATVATKLFAAAQAALNAVMELNPFYFVASIIALVGVAIYQCWQQFEGFRKFVYGLWEIITQFFSEIATVAKGIYHIISGIFLQNPSEIKKGLDEVLDVYENAGVRLATAYSKGSLKATVNSPEGEKGTEGKKGKKGLGIEPPSTDLATGASNVKETKPTIINITMGSLVDKFTITSNNLQEGAAKIREEVLKAMISAVNDSQVHAIGHT